MAYTKQTWETGDTIIADKLNHMEDGIAEGGSGGETFVVNFTYDDQTNKYTADKTFQEIETAAISIPVIGHIEYPDTPGVTYILGMSGSMQFYDVYVTGGDTGVIAVIKMEYDEETDEPTGFWTQNFYMFQVALPG